MSNRIMFGDFNGSFDYRLRASLPGANVLDPALPRSQVAFDSKWLDASNVLISGYVTLPATGTFIEVLYGKTFALTELPTAVIIPLGTPLSNTSDADPTYPAQQTNYYTQGPGGDIQQGRTFMYTDRMRIYGPGSAIMGTTSWLCYILMRRKIPLA